MAEKKKTSIGGQALLEGIMMRGPQRTAMAVRNPQGEIVLEEFPTQVSTRAKILKAPFVRGIFNMYDSLKQGYRCLMRSAQLAGLEEEEEKKEKSNKIVSARIMPLAVVLAVSFATRNRIYWLMYNTLIEKFASRSDSVTERTEAISVDLQIFLQNPVFGAKLSDVLHAVRNNTTSTLILYAVFGFLSGSFHIAAWITLVWSRERRVWANLALLVILFMSFNTQNLTGDVFFWLFPVMALVERGLPLLKKPEKG